MENVIEIYDASSPRATLFFPPPKIMSRLDISEFGSKMMELADLSDEELDTLILEEKRRIHEEMKRKLKTRGEEMI